jgi:isoamylase
VFDKLEEALTDEELPEPAREAAAIVKETVKKAQARKKD